MRALAKRGTTAAFDPVLAIHRSTTGEERAVAGQTLQDIAKPGQEPTLLAFLKEDVPNRTNLENAVINLLRQNKDVAGRCAPILKELDQSTGDYRKSLNRIVGRIGGQKVLEHLSQGAKAKATDEAWLADLVTGLSGWPDRTASPLLRELMTSDHSSIASEASRAYIRLLSMPGGGDDSANWKFVLEKAARADALSVFDSMADNPSASTIAFLTAGSSVWERAFQQTKKSVEEAAAAAIPVQSGKTISAKLAKPKGEPDDSTYVEEGSYWAWMTPNTWFIWVLNFSKPGTYKLEVMSSAENGGGSDFIATLAGQKLTCQSVGTPSKTAFTPAKINGNGTFEIKADKVGVHVLGLQGGAVTKPKIANITGVRLTLK